MRTDRIEVILHVDVGVCKYCVYLEGWLVVRTCLLDSKVP